MQRALVLGQAIATAKHPTMAATRLLVMQPLDPRERADGDPLLAVDQLGAATGSVAIISSDGKHAQSLFGKTTPVRYVVVGLEDARR
jgi:ethanolamine utilization protein EutN